MIAHEAATQAELARNLMNMGMKSALVKGAGGVATEVAQLPGGCLAD